MSTGTWSLRRRLAGASALLALLAALLVLLASITLGALVRTQQRVTGELFEAVIESAFLFRSVVDQDSAVRGYALSGDRSVLQSFDAGVRREAQAYSALKAFYVDDPALDLAVDRLKAANDGWRSEAAQPLIADVAARGPQIIPPERLAEGRRRFEEVRAANAAHRDLLLAEREREQERLTRETVLLVAVLVIASITALVAGLAVWRAVRRWVRQPLEDLAREVRTVQSGQLGHRIAVRGPDEVQLVAVDVDAMRERIVQEYAGARAAQRDAEVSQRSAEVAQRSAEMAQRRLEDQTRELERSNRDLEQFAYVASHDLQEPLRKVASFCQLLQRRYAGQLDDRADQYIGFAVDGAKRMQDLINDLLAFSRVGRVSGGFAEVPLEECLQRALRALEPLREERGGRVTADPLPVVRGEASLVTQLLQNLIGNALKFARPGVPPVVHVGAAPAATGEGDFYELSVSDNGIGIEPQYAEKIFVIFQRLHAKERYGGTGIGLALCKRIVEYHGGDIWLDTTGAGAGAATHDGTGDGLRESTGAGTVFRFTLPAALPSAPASAPTSGAVPSSTTIPA